MFVFGSNLAGRHGRGAALTARLEWGAEYGVGEGRTGNAYGIPTKDGCLRSRPLKDIRGSVRLFLAYAATNHDTRFLVSRIGCGLAGYTNEQIAPMFVESPNNCVLPTEWNEVLMAEKEYKKYDTIDEFWMAGVRLAKDARVNEGQHGKMVGLTFVSTSRKDQHVDKWVGANVCDFQADKASFLRKGDVLHKVTGKPVWRLWGDDNENESFELDQARIAIPLELEKVLKERGYVPGAGGTNGGKGAKGAKGTKKLPPKSPAAKTATREIDDDFDGDDDGDGEE